MSVIVPVYNDACGLRDTLRSLLEQDYPRSRYEIVIVDNGSTDATSAVAHRFEAAHPGVVRALEEKDHRGSYAARNKGIAAATGEILCFIDADMIAQPTYLARVNEYFRSDKVYYLGCSVRVTGDGDTVAARYNRAHAFPMRDYLERLHFSGAGCLAIRRSVLEDVGVFDSRLESGGDFEFGQRVHAAGYRQHFAPDIVLFHPARTTYGSLLAKARRIARGGAQLAHFYPERFAAHARRTISARNLLPQRPALIRKRYHEAGMPVGGGTALLIALWSLPLKWVRPLSYLRETRRLRSISEQRHRAVDAPRALAAGRTDADGSD